MPETFIKITKIFLLKKKINLKLWYPEYVVRLQKQTTNSDNQNLFKLCKKPFEAIKTIIYSV